MCQTLTLRHDPRALALLLAASLTVMAAGAISPALPGLRKQFPDTAEYYSTLFHEATHSTGHPKRLDRLPKDAIAAHFGSEEYSKEELVAEIGAASILNVLGIETAGTFKNSAAYIRSWLKALKNDKRMIVSAAGSAETNAERNISTAE